VLQAKPSVHIDPVPDSAASRRGPKTDSRLTALIDSAYQNRTDLKIARINTSINRLSYDYRKPWRWPDLTPGYFL